MNNYWYLFIFRFAFWSVICVSSCLGEGAIEISEIEKSLETQTSKANNSKNKPSKNLENANLENAILAKIIVLNKITTKYQEIVLKLGEVKFFGNLSLEVKKCIKDTDPYNPNNLMLLTIHDNKVDDDQSLIFSGWVMSANSCISNFEHSVYEIIPKECLYSVNTHKTK